MGGEECIYAMSIGATTRGFAAVESRVWARRASTDVQLKVTNASYVL